MTLLEKGRPILDAMREVRPDADCLLYLAQAALESGRFNRIIGNHNAWGIKSFKGWTGLTAEVVTHEKFRKLEDANRFVKRRGDCAEAPEWHPEIERWVVRLTDTFRDWESWVAAAQWYFGLLDRRYPGAYYARCAGCLIYGLTHGDGGRKYFTNNPKPYVWAVGKIHDRLIEEERSQSAQAPIVNSPGA